MATRADRESARLTRDDMQQRATGLGHRLGWRLGDLANNKGQAYYFIGTCTNCAAEVSAGASWSSCGGVRDARKVTCSGPGTSVLTEIETERSHELIADAVADFGRACCRCHEN